MQGYTRNKKQVFSSDEYAKIVNKKNTGCVAKTKQTRKKVAIRSEECSKSKTEKKVLYLLAV